MEQSQQLYLVSVEHNDGFDFRGCHTKDEVYSLFSEHIIADNRFYDKIIEDGGIETDEVEICINVLTTHSSETPEAIETDYNTIDNLLSEFDKMTLVLAKDGSQIKDELTPEQCNLIHMCVGVSTEANELLDAIKKHTIY